MTNFSTANTQSVVVEFDHLEGEGNLAGEQGGQGLHPCWPEGIVTKV